VGGDVSSAVPPKAILETVLYAKDLRAVEAFYRRALGLEPFAKADGRQVFYRCGEQMLLFFNPDVTELPPDAHAKLPVPPHGARGEGHVCFRASAHEITAWRAHLEQVGIEIEADFEWPGGGRSIYFRDPAGNCIEFAEARIWGLS
jgi:catechol 2,3-dioxygenase-like lactoylglutathione lyase family enzyme